MKHIVHPQETTEHLRQKNIKIELEKKNIKSERKGGHLVPCARFNAEKKGETSQFVLSVPANPPKQGTVRRREVEKIARRGALAWTGRRLLAAAPRESGSGIGDVSPARSSPGLRICRRGKGAGFGLP